MSTDETQRWRTYARSDLDLALKLLREDPAYYSRQICFLAQQSVEKVIKAALIFAGLNPPRAHDLDQLRNLLPDGWRVKVECQDLASLSIWAVEARYPGDLPDALEADAQLAVQQAQTVWKSITADLNERGLVAPL